jgi:hypothetical protein
LVSHGHSKLGLGYLTGYFHFFPIARGLGSQWPLGHGRSSVMYLIAVESILETQAFSLMAGLALALMVIVTGGVIYLTAADWRDRRRRKQDREASQPQRAKMGKKNQTG